MVIEMIMLIRLMKIHIELARFRAEIDDFLYAHLKNAPKNACYTSKTVQNQMIFIIGNQIHDDILEEV